MAKQWGGICKNVENPVENVEINGKYDGGATQ
jgi:hypothetical protein